MQSAGEIPVDGFQQAMCRLLEFHSQAVLGRCFRISFCIELQQARLIIIQARSKKITRFNFDNLRRRHIGEQRASIERESIHVAERTRQAREIESYKSRVQHLEELLERYGDAVFNYVDSWCYTGMCQ